MIGRVKVPDGVFNQLRAAKMFFIEMPQEIRAQRLVADYGKAERKDLRDALLRIQKRLGPQHCKTSLEALEAGDLFTVAKTALTYYDKAYLRGCEERKAERVERVPVTGPESRLIAEELMARVKQGVLKT